MLTFNSAALSSLVLAGVGAGVGATLGLVSADGVDACNVAAGFNGADACFSGFSHLKTRLDLVIQKTAINLPFTFTLTGRDHRGIRTYLCLQKCLGYW